MPGTTGPSLLPDVGELSYNGIKWSALYKSNLEGQIVPDEAKRTTKYVEWTLTTEGVVTLEANQATTDATFAALRQQLSVHGQSLRYNGKGFGDLNVNGIGSLLDVAWGPIPKVISFHPLGQSRSALLTWRVTTRIPELTGSSGGNGPFLKALGLGQPLQFNYQHNLTYDTEGYAAVSFKGTLEIPLSRGPNNAKALAFTVDDFRQKWLNIAVDLTKYKVVNRDFAGSRDKRTYEWVFEIQQLAPSGLPLGSTGARGTASIRNMKGKAKQGSPIGSMRWLGSLKCTYTLRPDFDSRIAYLSFISLLWARMTSALNGTTPGATAIASAFQQTGINIAASTVLFPNPKVNSGQQGALDFYQQLMDAQGKATANTAKFVNSGGLDVAFSRALLSDFGVDEGLYDDSKSMTFQASWSFFSNFKTLLNAAGFGAYSDDVGGAVWAQSMKDIMGWRSCLAAQIDPAAEVIIDMSGGNPMTNPLKSE